MYSYYEPTTEKRCSPSYPAHQTWPNAYHKRAGHKSDRRPKIVSIVSDTGSRTDSAVSKIGRRVATLYDALRAHLLLSNLYCSYSRFLFQFMSPTKRRS